MGTPGPNDTVIAVMGMTGSGKSTFIQNFTKQDLNIGHGLESCTAVVEVVPCSFRTGEKFFLVDTPGFDDSSRTDSEILCEVANWLNESFHNKVKLTGLIYLHRIIDPRLGGAALKNQRMFRKLCGDHGLGSVVLATTMWSLCTPEDAARREKQLINQSDLWQGFMKKGSQVMRQDDGYVSGQKIIGYLMQRNRPVILEIQREMGEEGKTLSKTNAGKEVQADLDKMKEEHAQELKEIKKDMEAAIKSKDVKMQQELKRYNEEITMQMAKAAQQAAKLEASRDQLRKEMQEQHRIEMNELKSEIDKRQQELNTSRQEGQRMNERFLSELAALKEKADRQEKTNKWKYNYNVMVECSECSFQYLFKNAAPPGGYKCRLCNKMCRLIDKEQGLDRS